MATIKQHYKYNYTATWIYKEFAVPNSRLKNAISNGKISTRTIGTKLLFNSWPKTMGRFQGLPVILPYCLPNETLLFNRAQRAPRVKGCWPSRWQDPEIYQWLMDSGFLDLQMQGMKKILQKLQIQTPPWTFVSWLPNCTKKWRKRHAKILRSSLKWFTAFSSLDVHLVNVLLEHLEHVGFCRISLLRL